MFNLLRFGKNCCDNMTVILIMFDHGDRSETGSSVISSVISRWESLLVMLMMMRPVCAGSRGRGLLDISGVGPQNTQLDITLKFKW